MQLARQLGGLGISNQLMSSSTLQPTLHASSVLRRVHTTSRTALEKAEEFSRRFGTAIPLIQAPMAGVQGSALAIAVSKSGGIGSLPCAMLSPDEMRKEIQAVQAQTKNPFNVNFFCHTQPQLTSEQETRWRNALLPHYKKFGLDASKVASGPGRLPFDEKALKVIEELKPPVVSFHFGLPNAELLERVRATGAKVISSATTVEEALWLESRGVDAIIAQGIEAGGHRGWFLTQDATTQMGTIALVRQLVLAVNTPIIATGGIADAQGVRAAMELGASAVQVGTSYLLCPEATTSVVHREALLQPSARHTALTNVFSGGLARGIMNGAMKELGPITSEAPPFPLASAAISPLRAHAQSTGSGDYSPLWAGQNVSGCEAIPAARITEELATGFETV